MAGFSPRRALSVRAAHPTASTRAARRSHPSRESCSADEPPDSVGNRLTRLRGSTDDGSDRAPQWCPVLQTRGKPTSRADLRFFFLFIFIFISTLTSTDNNREGVKKKEKQERSASKFQRD